MPFLLDTNVWVAMLRRRDAKLTARVKAHPPDQIYSCSVVRAELMFGAQRSADPPTNLALVESIVNTHPSPGFDDRAADQYSIIRAAVEAVGTPIGSNDYFIASIALANGLTLVTNNTREFARVPRLQIEDWQTP
jgi:tRNA(fMet)-specific endonuclease VapC